MAKSEKAVHTQDNGGPRRYPSSFAWLIFHEPPHGVRDFTGKPRRMSKVLLENYSELMTVEEGASLMADADSAPRVWCADELRFVERLALWHCATAHDCWTNDITIRIQDGCERLVFLQEEIEWAIEASEPWDESTRTFASTTQWSVPESPYMTVSRYLELRGIKLTDTQYRHFYGTTHSVFRDDRSPEISMHKFDLGRKQYWSARCFPIHVLDLALAIARTYRRGIAPEYDLPLG